MASFDLSDIFTYLVLNKMIYTYTFGINSNSRNLVPVLGGQTQNIATMGDRFYFGFQGFNLPLKDALRYSTHLSRALSQKVILRLPDFGFDQANTNVYMDSGSGQVVNLSGLPANYTLSVGQPFTIVHSNTAANTVNHYLHRVISSDVTANAGGFASVTMEPTLRQPPIANSVILLDEPVIEGFIDGSTSYNMAVGYTLTAPLDVKIVEAE